MKKVIAKLITLFAVTLSLIFALVSCSNSVVTSPKGETGSPETEINVVTENVGDHGETEKPQVVNVESTLWPERSLEELVTDAELIVRAKYVGHDPSYRNEEGTDRHVYTDHRFEVLEAYKGDRKVGDEVVVKCYGGEFEGQLYVSEDQTQFKDGQEYIMILTNETDENDVPTENDKYWHYPPKGILALDEDGKYTAIDPSVSFTAEEFRSEVEKILG